MPFLRKIRELFSYLLYSKSKNEDKARREFIFNVISLSIVGLSIVALCNNIIWFLLGTTNSPMPISAIFILMSFFGFLYFLSRKGFSQLASYLLLIIFFLITTYQIYAWGVDLPFGLLSYILIIVMAGVLISTRFAFIATLLTGGTMAIIGYLQNTNIVPPNRYWIVEIWNVSEIIATFVMMLIIATVSWLSNREIEKSLKRARKSEKDLKYERDMLEVTVEKRTKELRDAQAEKLGQLYRFAEFGRISSGLFHDLLNPLQAVSLNMEKIKSNKEKEDIRSHLEQIGKQTGAAPLSEVVGYVDSAIRSAKKLEDLVLAVRKQLIRKEHRELFSLNEEIAYVIDVLSHKAQKAHVKISVKLPQNDVKLFGDATKFNQIVLNLIANAIDSYVFPNVTDNSEKEKRVQVSLIDSHTKVILQVADQGSGIAESNINKIFEPFFTTKTDQGIGLGLSMTKRIVEKDFGGTISVSSQSGNGAIFTVELPSKNDESPSKSNR